MKTALRSVLPAGAILALVAALALLVTRSTVEPSSPPQPRTPPAGYLEVASVPLDDETRVSLWLGRIDPPKPDDCWYLVRRSTDGDLALGACGGQPAQPWVVRFAGTVAG